MVFKSVWTVIRGWTTSCDRIALVISAVPSEKENVRATSRPIGDRLGRGARCWEKICTSRIFGFDIESILRVGDDCEYGGDTRYCTDMRI
jgi:hypothetical protein